MPLPADEKLIALSDQILQQFDTIFGLNPGFRPAHAKGIMLAGAFTPSAEAATLTRAPHIVRESTPVTVRFSDSTGIPLVPDNDPNANPRGFAIRFNLAEHVHTDIVSHSTDGFPTRTGQEFLELLTALATSDPKNLAGTPLEAFLGSHPKALAFVQAPKPAPSSFARESYFGVTAMKFTNKDGVSRFGRYRIVPEAGNDHLDDAAAAAKGPDYLMTEIVERVGRVRSSSRSWCRSRTMAMWSMMRRFIGRKIARFWNLAHSRCLLLLPTRRVSRSRSSSIRFRGLMELSLRTILCWSCGRRFI